MTIKLALSCQRMAKDLFEQVAHQKYWDIQNKYSYFK